MRIHGSKEIASTQFKIFDRDMYKLSEDEKIIHL